MTEDARLRPLKLFNEKADKLLKSRFAEFILQQKKLSVKFNWEKDRIIKHLPDQHAIDEFVLTFRFFLQDNERSSFRNMAKTYSNLHISAEQHLFPHAASKSTGQKRFSMLCLIILLLRIG